MGCSYEQSFLLETLSKAYEQIPNRPSDLMRIVNKFGCGPDKISRRSVVDLDIVSCDRANSSIEDKLAIYNESLAGEFDALVGARNYSHLFHVTCTGYSAPSLAQRYVAKFDLNETTVTHLYHMGCYASVPAVRLAKLSSLEGKVRVVHSEICSIHFRNEISAENLVIQSLFGDGAIAYTVQREEPDHGFRIVRTREETIPNTDKHMSWITTSKTYKMSLSREVPILLSSNLKKFMERLAGDVPLKDALFAVHPGGPRIISAVEAELELSMRQVAHSKDILFNHGNMSSATLPFIWNRILMEPEIDHGQKVISLAFGPGLTICGAVFEVVKKAKA